MPGDPLLPEGETTPRETPLPEGVMVEIQRLREEHDRDASREKGKRAPRVRTDADRAKEKERSARRRREQTDAQREAERLRSLKRRRAMTPEQRKAASVKRVRRRQQERIAAAFPDGPAVSRAEEQAFLRLAEVVPPGARVMNDPYDGSPLMYALAGTLPVFVQPLHEQLDLAGLTPERRLLFTSFHRLDDDPAVRDVVRQMGITHAVVSDGLVYTAPGTAPGMRELDRVDSLHLLFRTPSTTVYEVRLDDGLAAG